MRLHAGVVAFDNNTYLPSVSSSPLAVYSTAKLVRGYAGASTRVVRASDSTTQDISFGSDGKIDMVSAATFRGASELVCDIAYDQSGNGYNALQTTNGNRPRLRSENSWRSAMQGWTHDGYIAATAGTKVSKHFDLPATVSINRSDVTVFCVAAPRVTYNNASLWEIGTAATNRLNLFVTTAVAGTRSAYGTLSTPTVVTSSKYMVMSPEVYVVRTNGTNAKIWQGDIVDTLTKPSSGTISQGRLGGSGTLGDFHGRAEIFAWVVYPAGLSDSDVSAVTTALRAVFPLATAQNDYVVFDGDSLTEGIADTYLKNAARYVADNLTSNVMMANAGVYGVTAATTYARRVQLWDGIDRTVSGTKVAVIALGINDISASTLAAALWTDTLLPYIEYVQGRGYSVIVATLTPTKAVGFTADMETERLALNTLIRDNAAAEGYTLADYCANAAFDTQNDADNTTYYTADKVHHTTAAFDIKGGILLPLVESLLA